MEQSREKPAIDPFTYSQLIFDISPCKHDQKNSLLEKEHKDELLQVWKLVF